MKGRRFHCLIRQNRIVSSRVRELSGSRRRDRLCENSSPAGDPGKTTSTVSIWRVFFGGEGSENPFFVLPKRHFGVFAQPGEEADFSAESRPPPHVGGYQGPGGFGPCRPGGLPFPRARL